ELHAELLRLQPRLQRPGVQLRRRDRRGNRPCHGGARLRRADLDRAKGAPAVTRREAPAVRPRSKRRGRRPRPVQHSPTLTVAMALMLVYTLIPLAWLLINSTKDTQSLFSSFGLGFGHGFRLWSNIHEVLTVNGG